MGLIKEPKGVDLLVGPSILTEQDRKMISEIIANYKLTGKLPTKKKQSGTRRRTGSRIQKKKVTA
jgi:hypothetical protein